MEYNLEITDLNRSILSNFMDTEMSNAECLFMPEYDIELLYYLDGRIESFQKHKSFNNFLDSTLREQYQFVDMQDTITIDADTSVKLFQRVRGKTKIIMYDSSKPFHVDFLKYCTWLRMYTWKKQ